MQVLAMHAQPVSLLIWPNKLPASLVLTGRLLERRDLVPVFNALMDSINQAQVKLCVSSVRDLVARQAWNEYSAHATMGLSRKTPQTRHSTAKTVLSLELVLSAVAEF